MAVSGEHVYSRASLTWAGRLMFLLGAILIFVAAFALTGIEYLLAMNAPGVGDSNAMLAAALLAQWVLVGIFPISAIAYVRSVRSIQQAEKRKDFSRLNTTNCGAQMDHLHQTYSNSNYLLLSIPVVLLTVLGVSLFYRPPTKLQLVPDGEVPGLVSAVRFGFLGAYVFCFQLIRRRYTTRDLQPFVYMTCAGVLLAGMTFNFVAFSAVSVLTNGATTQVETQGVDGSGGDEDIKRVQLNKPASVGSGIAAIVAFSLGYFQYLALRWFRQLAFSATRQQERRSDALPLGLIDGLSQLHEERLQDEGIDNLQNLAAADLDQLVGNTPFNSQELIDWVDQAVLYVYLEPNEIDSFRRGGIRSVTDFQDHWRAFYILRKRQISGELMQIPQASSELETDRKAFAQQLQSTPERLDSLYRTTEAGPNMHRIETYWQGRRTETLKATGDADSLARARMGMILRGKVRQIANAGGRDAVKELIASLYHRTDSDRTVWSVTANSEEIIGQAWLAREEKQLDESIALYMLAKERFPQDPVALNDLAWLCLELLKGKAPNDVLIERYKITLKEALKDARKAVDLAKESSEYRNALPGFLDTLAWAEFFNENLFESAKANLESTQAWVELNMGPVHECIEAMFNRLSDEKLSDEAKKVLDETRKLISPSEDQPAEEQTKMKARKK